MANKKFNPIKNLGIYAKKKRSPLIGRKRPIHVIKAISLANKGKHLSPETEFKKGEDHPMYKQPLPKWWRDKISKGNKGKKKPTRTEEHKKNMSLSIKKSWKEGRLKINSGCFKKGHKSWSTGLTKETDERIKRYCEEHRSKQILPIKDTKIEVKIQNFLKQLGIEFYTHFFVNNIEHKYSCDIFIPSKKLIIECDGDYWHGNPQKFPNLNKYQLAQKERDEIRTQELIKQGYLVWRLWGHQIRNMNFNGFKNKLAYQTK